MTLTGTSNSSQVNGLAQSKKLTKSKVPLRLLPVFISILAGSLSLLFCETPNSFPIAEISNGSVRAAVALPDAERGYYRSSRFDWAGVVSRLEYNGHSFFGAWFPRYDPLLHDSITGPVEEFRTGSGVMGSALGFESARPGGLFVKIGVGVLRRPDAKAYSFARTYEIVNHGVWTSRPQKDRVEFEQELRDDSGYAYHYQKTIRLISGRPEMVLEHRLRNTGKLAIDTLVYNHDFYMLDNQSTGQSTKIIFTFEPRPNPDPSVPGAVDLDGKAEIHGKEITYTRELQPHEQASSLLTGFSTSAKDNDVRVENKKAGIGVREIGDHPLAFFNLWSIRTTVCPEGFIHLHIEPGKEARWSIRYVFYELPK